MGLDIGAISATIRPLFAGEVVTRWEDPTGEERDVRVQLAPELRRSIADVSALPVPTAKVGPNGVTSARLGDVAHISVASAPSQIDRMRLERVVSISGNTSPGISLSEASSAIRTEVAKLALPPGYTVNLGGQTEMLAETGGYVIEAIMLAVILIFLILASQFESFTQPVAIMLSLPLSLVGVLLALLLTRTTLNIMSMIGVIMLMGLVTKNAILLVDNANERRRSGTHRFDALVEAGAVRLRPIMMTTLAMIAGMLPIALALGEGGEFRAPMARAVIGGLITSTMLTLIVVPVAYTYFDDFGSWVKRRFVDEQREMEITAEQGDHGRLHHSMAGERPKREQWKHRTEPDAQAFGSPPPSVGAARRYWAGQVTGWPSSLAARSGQYGSRSISRASSTRSAWPLRIIWSACAASVMRPTAPVAMPASRRTRSANGTW